MVTMEGLAEPALVSKRGTEEHSYGHLMSKTFRFLKKKRKMVYALDVSN